MSCIQTKRGIQENQTPFTGAKGEVELIVLAPGHFHASLLQKNKITRVNDTVYVFAIEGVELNQYLSNIETYNTRAEDPTSWHEIVYMGEDFLDRIEDSSTGNVVVLAGKNRDKTEYIHRAIVAGKNVLSDKPMAIKKDDFNLLEESYNNAASNDLYIYDVMTERYDILNIIEKELIADTDFFGELQQGTTDEPSIYMESIHHFYKEVSGIPLIRPTWYYDVDQQGEGIADVTTHLIDQVFWKCFPEQAINYKDDVGEIRAMRWPTELSFEQYRRSTGAEKFPPYLEKDIENSILKVYANGTIQFDVKSHNVKLKVLWNWQAPEGGGDTFKSEIKGTKAVLKTEQNKAQNFVKQLYVQRPPHIEEDAFLGNLQKAIERITSKYSFVTYSPTSNTDEYLINIPVENREGHESHFTYVAEKFFDHLVNRDMPKWETTNTLSKYYITTKAVEIANE